MASPQAEPRPPFTYSLPAYAARRPTVLSPALRTNLVPNLMNRNTGRIASSRLTSMPPETPSVNLECSPPPPDLNLPDACSPLCYTDPGLHPELLTCSLELRPGEVLQANAAGFHLRVPDLSNTKERKNTHNVSAQIQYKETWTGFPDILASHRHDTDDCAQLKAEDRDEATTCTALQGTDTCFRARAQVLSRARLSAPTVHGPPDPLPTVFSQQEHWSRLLSPSPRHTP